MSESTDRSMASNRKALFDVISSLKDDTISIEKGMLVIKACHEITDTFRVEIKGCEVAAEMHTAGLKYSSTVKELE